MINPILALSVGVGVIKLLRSLPKVQRRDVLAVLRGYTSDHTALMLIEKLERCCAEKAD